MKNLFIVVLGALALGLTGCKYETSEPIIYARLRISHEEQSGLTSRFSRYSYNQLGQPERILVTDNGVQIYEDKDYKYDNTLFIATWYRTDYLKGKRYELNSYSIANWAAERRYEMVEIDGSGNKIGNPVEYLQREFNTSLESRVEHEEILKDNVLTIKSNYEYDGRFVTFDLETFDPADSDVSIKREVRETYADSARDRIVTVEISDGEKLVEYQLNYYNNNSQTGYVIYRGDDIQVTTGGSVSSGGVLVEEADNFSSSQLALSYVITRWNDEGKNPVSTTIKDTYEVFELRPTEQM